MSAVQNDYLRLFVNVLPILFWIGVIYLIWRYNRRRSDAYKAEQRRAAEMIDIDPPKDG
jgi:hypothetical protein